MLTRTQTVLHVGRSGAQKKRMLVVHERLHRDPGTFHPAENRFSWKSHGPTGLRRRQKTAAGED